MLLWECQSDEACLMWRVSSWSIMSVGDVTQWGIIQKWWIIIRVVFCPENELTKWTDSFSFHCDFKII